MSPHNKRGKAKQAVVKERRAEQHHQRTSTHASTHQTVTGYGVGGRCRKGRRAPAGTTSYLAARTNERTTRPSRTFAEADPLDQQLFDYLIVVDVEATCVQSGPGGGGDNFPHEVIELPAVLIDVRRGVVDQARSFRTFIKPQLRPQLSAFCSTLTGIRQADVDHAPSMREALQRFEAWYRNTIPRGSKAVFAADGPWDFKKFIYECHVLRDGVSVPSIFYEYIDIRTTFAHYFNHGKPIKLEPMLHKMGLQFEGRPHCGFDDAVNIARLAVAMMRAGCIFNFLACIPLVEGRHYELDGYPVYRRTEGSGQLDRDIVDDIAKRCYGRDYFSFGERHRAEVAAYRERHPRQFAHTQELRAKRRDRALRATASLRTRRLLQSALFVVGCVVAALLVVCYLRLRTVALQSSAA